MKATRRNGQARLAVNALGAVCAGWLVAVAAPQAAPDLIALMRQIDERLVEHYRRAQSVIWMERSTVQPIQSNWTPDGFARTVESELRVEWPEDGSLAEPRWIRDIRLINGRAPRERDKKDRTGCTDPEAASPAPLAFLLALHRNEYEFRSVAHGVERHRAALMIDFRSANRTTRPELVEDPRGHDDCFDWKGPVATSGRLWVDAESFDVLRVDRRNEGPVDVQVPLRIQRRYRLPPWVVIDRDDLTMRYSRVAFTDPDEVIVLPESLQTLTVLRSGLQSTRRTEEFGGYRRFLTTGRIKER